MNKWKNQIFKFDGIVKKLKNGNVGIGKEYPNTMLWINKEKIMKMSWSSDESPIFLASKLKKK